LPRTPTGKIQKEPLRAMILRKLQPGPGDAAQGTATQATAAQATTV
jgi:hypothetical protein